ncbi:MAG: DEAD/DEAH box helicase, partial [Actinomycetota bacterium]
MTDDPLRHFSAPTRAWFEQAFAAPTPAQVGAWDATTRGEHALVIAPTGSGKTLAGFLWSLDLLLKSPPAGAKQPLRVLYVSPLKALAVDVERNLRTPLAGIGAAAGRLELDARAVRVGVRTGDTPPEERRRFATHPPDILITTPESLFLLLTSQARAALRSVETVIVDEIHALAPNKRGAHLALSLERLDSLLERPAQRLGLSATVRPPEVVANFLAGGRPVRIVDPGSDKRFELQVVVPVEDMTDPDSVRRSRQAGPERLEESQAGQPTGDISFGAAADGGSQAVVPERTSVWPHVEERLFDLIARHKSTIVFVNSRRLAERLCGRLNEIAAERRAGPAWRDRRTDGRDDL